MHTPSPLHREAQEGEQSVQLELEREQLPSSARVSTRISLARWLRALANRLEPELQREDIPDTPQEPVPLAGVSEGISRSLESISLAQKGGRR
jgi:hypothetical protein